MSRRLWGHSREHAIDGHRRRHPFQEVRSQVFDREIPSTSREVPALAPPFGSARLWRRAAMFGVFPSASCPDGLLTHLPNYSEARTDADPDAHT